MKETVTITRESAGMVLGLLKMQARQYEKEQDIPGPLWNSIKILEDVLEEKQ